MDDAKKLYSGFDLSAPTTSVSMTINGPAPIILAFFMNAAIDQNIEKHEPALCMSEQIDTIELMRSDDSEKHAQIDAVHRFQARAADRAPAALARLKEVARARGNVFAELMETVKVASLGQISGALHAAGSEYRRNM